MEPIVALHIIVPDRRMRSRWLQNDVHEVSILGVGSQSLPYPCIGSNGVGCRRDMDEMCEVQHISKMHELNGRIDH